MLKKKTGYHVLPHFTMFYHVLTSFPQPQVPRAHLGPVEEELLRRLVSWLRIVGGQAPGGGGGFQRVDEVEVRPKPGNCWWLMP